MRSFKDIQKSFAEKERRERFSRPIANLKEDIRAERAMKQFDSKKKKSTFSKVAQTKLKIKRILTKHKQPTLVVEVERRKPTHTVSALKKVVEEDRRNFFFK